MTMLISLQNKGRVLVLVLAIHQMTGKVHSLHCIVSQNNKQYNQVGS